MQTKSRRAFFVTAAATAVVSRCSPPAIAAPSPDADLLRLGAEFDRVLTEQCDAGCLKLEAAADRVMAVQPATLAGLALWARIMTWRFDPTLRGIEAEPSAELAEYGVNEAFALAAAIERLAVQS